MDIILKACSEHALWCQRLQIQNGKLCCPHENTKAEIRSVFESHTLWTACGCECISLYCLSSFTCGRKTKRHRPRFKN